MAVQEAVRANALHQRVNRQNQHAARQGGQLVQGGETGGDNVLMGREAVVGQRFPVSKIGDRQIGKLSDLLLQSQGRLHIRGNHQHRTVVAFGDAGTQPPARRRPAGRADDGRLLLQAGYNDAVPT